jgi:REP element-mobilizing transposase RayT
LPGTISGFSLPAMARPLRIEYPGAVYHVMARGNQGRDIFRDDEDRLRWLKTLGESCQKTGWRVHAYVLMSNHYHLLVQTPEGNLVAGMKWLQAAYTQRYNSRHKVFGHLFQGRYKAIVVDGQDRMYLQVVSTYIHLNPARAGLIRIGEQSLNTYRWSSYPAYLKADGKATPWLQRDKVLGSLGLGEKDGKGYEAYLEGRSWNWPASKAGRTWRSKGENCAGAGIWVEAAFLRSWKNDWPRSSKAENENRTAGRPVRDTTRQPPSRRCAGV